MGATAASRCWSAVLVLAIAIGRGAGCGIKPGEVGGVVNDAIVPLGNAPRGLGFGSGCGIKEAELGSGAAAWCSVAAGEFADVAAPDVVPSCIGFGSGCGIKAAALGRLTVALGSALTAGAGGTRVVAEIVGERFECIAAGGGAAIAGLSDGERLDFVAAGGGAVIATFEGDKLFGKGTVDVRMGQQKFRFFRYVLAAS